MVCVCAHTHTHTHTCFPVIYTHTLVSLWYIQAHIVFPHLAWISTSAPPSWAPGTLGWCSVKVR